MLYLKRDIFDGHLNEVITALYTHVLYLKSTFVDVIFLVRKNGEATGIERLSNINDITLIRRAVY